MMKIGTKFTAAIVGSMMLASGLVQAADWQPDGDIRLQIGFPWDASLYANQMHSTIRCPARIILYAKSDSPIPQTRSQK